jgi:ribonuclease-3
MGAGRVQQEGRTLEDFQRHFQLTFSDPELLKLALTHRSYLSVTGQGPRASNERLEFLGDSVLGLVTSEFLYRRHPDEHEGELTKNKSLLVSKAILSRRALAMGLGRFVLMSHSEVESGGRQRLSILADAFEAVIGAIYLDQGFEAARAFIHRWLLREAGEIVADKRHTNYKSHLQEYVQSTWRTHPVYRIRSEMGPDHSKHFLVEVMVGKRNLGEGRGRNKKEAEQAAARDALEKAGAPRDTVRASRPEREERRRGESESRRTPEYERAPEERESSRALAEPEEADTVEEGESEEHGARRRRRGRRGGRGRRRDEAAPAAEAPARPAPAESEGRLATPSRRLAPLPDAEAEGEPLEPAEIEPPPMVDDDEDFEEVGRPVGPNEELHVDPFAMSGEPVDQTPDFAPEASSAKPSRFEAEVVNEDREEFEGSSHTGDEPTTGADEPLRRSPEPDRTETPPKGKPSESSSRNFGRRRGRR